MTSFLFFDGPRSDSEIDFVSQTKGRPDSRPTKHQKEERVRRGGVDTQRARQARKFGLCCMLRGWRTNAAKRNVTHTSPLIRSTSRHFFVFDSGACFFVLLRDFFCHFPNFCSSTFFSHPQKKRPPSRFCTMLIIALCGVGLVGGRFSGFVGEKGLPLRKFFFGNFQFFFSRHTQKRRRRTCKTRSGHGKRVHEMKFRARTKMRLLLCRRRGRSKNTLSR